MAITVRPSIVPRIPRIYVPKPTYRPPPKVYVPPKPSYTPKVTVPPKYNNDQPVSKFKDGSC